MINIKQNLVSPSKYSIKCPYAMTPKFIVIHNTANDASAVNEVKYMIGNNNYTGFHIAIDDKEGVQGIPLNRNSFNAGDGANGNGNRNGIAIEICYSKSGGSRFTQAEKNTAEYVAYLLKQYGWGISKVKKHQDFNKGNCPHRTIDLGWQRFLNMVKDYMGKNPTPDQILTIGSIVTLPGIYTVTSVKNGLIGIKELTGETNRSYHWFNPQPFDVVDNKGNKVAKQICYKGSKVKLNGMYAVQKLAKTNAWACKLTIGGRTNWVYCEPCYEVKD